MKKYFLIFVLIGFLWGNFLFSANRLKGFWNDSSLTFKIKSAFYRSPIVSAWRIGVKTKRGVVTLYGRAKSEKEKREAERIVRRFKSVKDVINRIEVRTSRPSEVFKTTKEEKRSWWRKVSDYAITGQVKTAFLFNRNLKGARIKVTSRNGVVFLEGTVGSKKQKDLAGKIAQGVLGVKKVENLLHINSQ